MRPTLFFLASVIAAVSGSASSFAAPDPKTPGAYSRCVLGSDHATFRFYDGQAKKLSAPIVITDRSWIEQFAQVLAAAVYEPLGRIFAVSTSPVLFLDKDGRPLLRLELLMEGTVRMDSTDYRVGAKTFAALSDLLRAKEPGQPVPAPPPGG